jgi:hypothetical protein
MDPEILRIGSPLPVPATEERCTASSTGAAACRTSHVAFAPNLCNRECCPAARRLGQQLALVAISRPWPPSSAAQHSAACRRLVVVGSLARLRMRALHQANAHYSIKRRDDQERQMRAAPCPGLSGKSGWKRKGGGRKREGKQRHPPAHVSWSSVYF